MKSIRPDPSHVKKFNSHIVLRLLGEEDFAETPFPEESLDLVVVPDVAFDYIRGDVLLPLGK